MVKLFKTKVFRLGLCLSAVMLSVIGFALAEDTPSTVATMDSISTMTTTQLTTIQQALLNMISSVVPVAIVVMGSILVVTLGTRLFRRFAG